MSVEGESRMLKEGLNVVLGGGGSGMSKDALNVVLGGEGSRMSKGSLNVELGDVRRGMSGEGLCGAAAALPPYQIILCHHLMIARAAAMFPFC